jgi:hypothetical protein
MTENRFEVDEMVNMNIDHNELARGKGKKYMYIIQKKVSNRTPEILSFTSLKKMYNWSGWDVSNKMTYKEFKKIQKNNWMENKVDWYAYCLDGTTMALPYNSLIIYK